MINKTAKHNITRYQIEALNRPQGWEIFEGEQELSISRMKIASFDKAKDVDLDGFDIQAEIEKHPDHLFVKVFAIKKDEVNDNGDAFPADELRKGAASFIGVPVFCNHQNDDIEKARGRVVHAWYDEEKGGIWTVNMVDKVAYPKLARGIEEGYITGTSMGCQVHHSLCSICHNKAHTADEYCSHVRERKTKKFSGKCKCAFHKSKTKPDGDCPQCGCEPGGELDHKEATVHEWNYGLKFIEDSFVVNPACHDCLVDCILNVPEFTKKVGSVLAKARKLASDIGTNQLIKVAGKAEIDSLNKAMKHVEVVAKSMMDQKQQVSLEYVSDIVDVLASLQTVTDELVEMGYASIPSPPTFTDPMSLPDAVPMGGQQGMQSQPSQMQQPAAQPQPQQAPGAASSPAGNGLGSVTKPSFSPQAAGKLKELQKQGSKLKTKIARLADLVTRQKAASVDYTLTRNDITVAFSKREGGGYFVSAYKDDELITAGRDVEVERLFESNPDEAALAFLRQVESKIQETVKESESMSKETKTAAGSALKQDDTQVTIEKALNNSGDKLEFAGKRQYKEIDGVTESDAQLGQSKEPVNDTTSDSPQVRKGEYADEVQEGQLEALSGTPIARWNSAPDVIQEKNWRDFDRLIGAEGVEEQSHNVTQTQLEQLRSKHRWVEPNFTTQNQLASGDNWLLTDNAWLSKEASAAYAKKLVASAFDALSDAIAFYKRTPAEIVKAAKFMARDPQSQIKAAFLTLVNGIPAKVASRKAEKSRASYFDKVAGTTHNYQPVDALLGCMGDHCMNIKAEDFVDAVRHVASDPVKMAKVEAMAKQKLASASQPEADSTVDKFAAFDDAFKEMIGIKDDDESEKKDGDEKDEGEDKEASSEDGLYQVRAAAEEIGVAINAGDAFVVAAERHARGMVKAANGPTDTVLYSVEFDKESQTVITTLKETSKLSSVEINALEKQASARRIAARKATVQKTAQMMGGEMGGGMGGGGMGGGAGAGGAGATLPPPPGGAGAPPAPGMETMDADSGTDPEAEEGGEDGAPQPPGTICPLCGTKDVDVVGGKWSCNNPECGHKGIVEIGFKVLEGPMVGGGKDKEGGEEDAPIGGDAGSQEGEGFAMPGTQSEEGSPDAGAGAPSMPVAAATKIRPEVIQKLAKKGIEFGRVSPLTGSTNTFKVANNQYLCLDTGVTYNVEQRVNSKNVKDVYARWSWTPRFAGTECSSCNRARGAWTKALASVKLTDAEFDAMSFKNKAETVLAMQSKGLFKVVKTASKNASVIGEFQKAFKVAGAFPIAACKQKLANRFGENAVALSGPCKGDKISDCVCNQLKSAGVYSDGVAIKVAEAWAEKDACLECMEDFVRLGFDIERSASICNHLKVKYASDAELFAEEMGNKHEGNDDSDGGDFGGGDAPDSDGGDSIDTGDDFKDDPFSDGGDAGSEDGSAPDSDGGDIGGSDGLGDEGTDDGTDLGGGDDFGGGDGSGPVGDLGGGGAEIGGDLGGQPAHGTVHIELPLQALDAIEQAIDKAHGGGGEGHDLGGLPGDTEVDLTLDAPTADGLGDAAGDALDGAIDGGDGLNGEPSIEIDLGGPGDLQGVEGAPDGGMGDQSTDLGGDSSNIDEGAGDLGGVVDHSSDTSGGDENKEMLAQPQGNHMEQATNLAQYMRRGRQNRVGEINLDLSAVSALLKKQAGESEPKVEGAQDVVDGYTAGDGSVQGNEKKFDADKPKVPRNNATIGKEPSDLNPNDKPLPKIPAGGGELGHEKEQGYTAEKPNMSGGTGGQGKTPTASAKAPAKVAKQTKVADEKKVGPAKPVSEVTEVSYSANKDLESTPEKLKRKPFEESDSKEIKNVPEKGEGAQLGKEKDMGSVPKANDEYLPKIPAGGGRNSKYDKNEKNAPELQGNIKGTVIANDEKSKAVKAEAVRIAGRMIEEKLIDASQLLQKIAELAVYEMPQLKDIEKSLFRVASKGLNAAPDGVEQPVPVINEASAKGGTDIKSQLMSMMRLNKEVEEAEQFTDAALRKNHGR